jgi:ABC-type branched-subunit amino acid transport system substrate-binding protein
MPVNRRERPYQWLIYLLGAVLVLLVGGGWIGTQLSRVPPTPTSPASTQPSATAELTTEPSTTPITAPSQVPTTETATPPAPQPTVLTPTQDDRTTLVIAVPVYSDKSPTTDDTLISQTDGIARAVQLAIKNAEERDNISPTINLEMRRYEEKVDNNPNATAEQAAEQAARDILAEPLTRCVVGHYTSRSTGAAVEVYKQSGNEKLAVISPSSSATDLTNINQSMADMFLWRLVTTDTNQGYVGARFAFDELTKTHAFIVAGTAENQTKAADAFEVNFREQGTTVVKRPEFQVDPQKTYSFGDTLEDPEAKILLNQIIQWSQDKREDGVIYLAVDAKTAEQIFTKMIEEGVTLPVLGIDSLDRPGSNYPPVNFEVYITTMAMPSDFGRGAEFADDIGFSRSYAAEAYDAAMLCIQGITTSSTSDSVPSRSEVLARIRSITAEAVSLPKYYATEDTYIFWKDGLPGLELEYGDLYDFKLFVKQLVQGEANPLRKTLYRWDRSLDDRNNRRWVRIIP